MAIYNLQTIIHGSPGIELIGGNKIYHQFLRYCVTVNDVSNQAKQERQKSQPFLQGHDNELTWTLVEFWYPPAAETFTAWLNSQIQDNTEFYANFVKIHDTNN